MPQAGASELQGAALREAKKVRSWTKGLTAGELKLLGTLGSVLPALEVQDIWEPAAGPAPTAVGSWRRGWARARCRP